MESEQTFVLSQQHSINHPKHPNLNEFPQQHFHPQNMSTNFEKQSKQVCPRLELWHWSIPKHFQRCPKLHHRWTKHGFEVGLCWQHLKNIQWQTKHDL